MTDYTLMRFPNFKDKALTFSYDDGVVYDKRLLEIFNKNSLKGTFNINSQMFSIKGGARRMTEKEIIDLFSDSVHEIAVHGAMHLSLAAVSKEIATKDVLTDKMYLEKLFKKPIRGMAYANGSFNDEVLEILKYCGIVYSRTTKSTYDFRIPTNWLTLNPTCHHRDEKLMQLAEEFLDDAINPYPWFRTPKLFYVWGHSYEFNDNNNWEVIENFATFVGNRNDVWYATNIEIYNYIKAYDNLVWGVNGDFVYNPSCIDVYIDYLGKQIIACSGEIVYIK